MRKSTKQFLFQFYLSCFFFIQDILDVDCLTDGCQGTICRIVMIDEKQSVKKDVSTYQGFLEKKMSYLYKFPRFLKLVCKSIMDL